MTKPQKTHPLLRDMARCNRAHDMKQAVDLILCYLFKQGIKCDCFQPDGSDFEGGNKTITLELVDFHPQLAGVKPSAPITEINTRVYMTDEVRVSLAVGMELFFSFRFRGMFHTFRSALLRFKAGGDPIFSAPNVISYYDRREDFRPVPDDSLQVSHGSVELPVMNISKNGLGVVMTSRGRFKSGVKYRLVLSITKVLQRNLKQEPIKVERIQIPAQAVLRHITELLDGRYLHGFQIYMDGSFFFAWAEFVLAMSTRKPERRED